MRLVELRQNRLSLGVVGLLFVMVGAAVALAGISQVPLDLTKTAPPNIMIMLDNSGSMNTIMFHPAYDANVAWSGDFSEKGWYRQDTDGKTHKLVNGADSINDDSKGNFTVEGRKVKLPLPYDGTRWDGRYLNWIFYHATQEQYQSLSTDPNLGETRIEAARRVVSNLVKNVSGVRFGLACFIETSGGIANGGAIVKGCGELTPANVDSTVNGIEAKTWTPLGETLGVIWGYFKNGSKSLSLPSPITAWCQRNFAIVVTDGEPTYDGCYSNGAFADYGCDTGENAPSKLKEIATFMHSNDASAIHPDTQTVETYTVGLTMSSALLKETAAAGGGEYKTAETADGLYESLKSILEDIENMVSSAGAAAVTSGYLSANSKLFRARFHSGDWVGYLDSYGLDANGNIKGYPNLPEWEAGAKLNALKDARNIYTAGIVDKTYKRQDFVESNATNLAGATFMNFSTGKAATLVGYIRGDSNPAGYRVRKSKLGDIVQSSPVLSGPPAGYYTDNSYPGFKKMHAQRKSIVLAGANDGMLHAFSAADGNEEWAFIPNSLLPKLKLLRKDPYIHQNYVNGPITVGDAYISSKNLEGAPIGAAWRTVAVCGLREGGKSFFALDITNPLSPVPLWELTPAAPVANTLGYSFGVPLIVKLRDSSATGGARWVAILANGYEGNSAKGSAALLVVDLGSGAIIREIVVDSDPNTSNYSNGLSTPAVIDANGDGFADLVYAGDLQGHLWKFDLSNSDKSKWGGSFATGAGTPVALFSAVDNSKVPQPITTAPEVALYGGSQIVAFTTGKFYEQSDLTSQQVQAAYAVFDDNVAKKPNQAQELAEGMYTKSDLVKQALSIITLFGETYRISSNTPIGTKPGWYVELPAGERVVYDPIVRSKKLVFTSFLPNSEPCSYGGTSWLNEFNLFTGGGSEKPVYDLNKDGVIDAKDVIPPDPKAPPPAKPIVPGSLLLGEGIAGPPVVVDTGTVEKKYITKSDGTVVTIDEGKGSNRFGPRSWRQL